MEPQGIVWAGLQVENLAAAISFYRDVIGLPLRRSGADYAHFDAGGGALFELFSGGKAAAAAKDSAQQPLQIALRVGDLAAEVARLKARGVTFVSEIESFRSQSWATFVDLEGNRMELKSSSEVIQRRTLSLRERAG